MKPLYYGEYLAVEADLIEIIIFPTSPSEKQDPFGQVAAPDWKKKCTIK